MTWLPIGSPILAATCLVLSQGRYSLVGRRICRALLVSFGIGAAAFGGMFRVRAPWVNIGCLILAILFARCASVMIWTRYWLGLPHTGTVSTATCCLDFLSYLAAVSTAVVANAAEAVGWGNFDLDLGETDAPGRGGERPDSKIGIRNVLKAKAFDTFFVGWGFDSRYRAEREKLSCAPKRSNYTPTPCQTPPPTS